MPLTYALVVLFALATVQRTRRPRRAVNYDDSEPDDGDDEDLELGPPDDDGGWD